MLNPPNPSITPTELNPFPLLRWGFYLSSPYRELAGNPWNFLQVDGPANDEAGKMA